MTARSARPVSQPSRLLRTALMIAPSAVIAGCHGLGAAHQAALPTATHGASAVCASDDAQLLHVPSPDWREQIIYMAFIDRFEDGDPSNNDFGEGEYLRGSPAHFNGGDLPGTSQRLDYIKGLGATAVWVSPPVLNQWWSTIYGSTGWHGYWATDFSAIDPHFGTIDDYRALSHGLHCRDMYLIQDIVINHTGNFFGYPEGYDPDDTAKNFVLFEADTPHKTGPVQAPFDKIDRLNPEHAAAAIYNWTPPISDYYDLSQEKTRQLGHLADINTTNPVVIDAFKAIYGDWIEQVGVDGFRVDTARYVEQDFWHAFFSDNDGVYARARETGRDDFIAFGETFMGSKPFETDGERYIRSYYGDAEEPGFNSMIGFPMYFTGSRVFVEGAPTAQMAFRLNALMTEYPDPFTTPNFIDNHDTARFLSLGDRASFEQALLLMFTAPGVPIIYQGTEQALKESRQTLFAGGFGTQEDQFDPTSASYRLIQELSALRLGSKVFTRGDLTVLASEDSGPGVLAYRRSLRRDTAIVMFNTSRHAILAHGLETGLRAGTVLRGEGRWAPEDDLIVGAGGALTATLPARASWVLRPAGRAKPPQAQPITLTIDRSALGDAQTADFQIAGTVSDSETDVLVLRNGDLDRPIAAAADASGRWTATVPVRNLGDETITLQAYAPEAGAVSDRIQLATRVAVPERRARVDDPKSDDRGPSGRYVRQQQQESGAQKDLIAAEVRSGGANLELTLEMAQVSTVWQPFNGFDNLILSVFIDVPDREGVRVLPQLDAEMPDGLAWDFSHVATGWSSAMYAAAGASDHDRGDAQGVAPDIIGDQDAKTITLRYRGERIGVEDWAGATIYVTTWDSTQESGYIELTEDPSNWTIGGGAPGDPKVLDDLIIRIPD